MPIAKTEGEQGLQAALTRARAEGMEDAAKIVDAECERILATVRPQDTPLRYYQCTVCHGYFVQPPEGYSGPCKKCIATGACYRLAEQANKGEK